MPITDYLRNNAAAYGNEIALVEINPEVLERKHVTWRDYDLIESTDPEPYRREITWSVFDEKANRFSNLLLSRGVKKGDKVAILLMNCLEWLPIYFGILKSGATAVPLNFRYTAEEIAYCVKQADVDILVFGPQFTGRVEEIVDDISHGRLLFYVGEDCPTFAENYRELTANCPSSDPAIPLNEDEDAAIYFSSGTTGFPKGVMLTHRNILNDGFFIGEGMKLTPNDRVCLPVPYFHCFGCVLGIMAILTHRCTIVGIEDFDAEMVLRAIDRERATAVYGVPTMYIAELNHPDFEKYDMSSLRTGIMAGSPCPPATMQEVIDKMNMHDITICYGLTETSPVFTQTSVDDDVEHKCTTVGRKHPPVSVKVADVNTGEPLGPGEHGELCCRGYNVMKGYYKMPEETAKAIDEEGYLHSGDMGTIDEEGYFRVTGRIKDMIIRGGENIYPLEVENFLLTMPGVLDAQVVGCPDEKYGEVVTAFIRTREGYEDMTQEDVREYAIPRIARFKVPKFVFFVDEFPMNPANKIQKFKLRDMAKELTGRTDQEVFDEE